jgi:hypothetical protein
LHLEPLGEPLRYLLNSTPAVSEPPRFSRLELYSQAQLFATAEPALLRPSALSARALEHMDKVAGIRIHYGSDQLQPCTASTRLSRGAGKFYDHLGFENPEVLHGFP